MMQAIRQNMISYRRPFCLLLIALGALCVLAGFIKPVLAEKTFSDEAVLLKLNGPVTPASAGYLVREIESASARDARLTVIELDTPGGLVTSMKDIIKAILASETPVVTYVSPKGAQSASAGLYIMYAAHISAMAPATNTGAATPVEIGGGGSEDDPSRTPAERTGENQDEGEAESNSPDEQADQTASDTPALSNEDALRKKVINDSVAYIRSLAEQRDRNADWAERAVREAVSVSSNEALELNVIDLIAEDLDALFVAIDGTEVTTAAGPVIVETENIAVTEIEPALWEKILGFFADPNVAAILLTLGTTGLIAEIWNPGSIFPGAFGLICLLLALYSFSVLPYNGLALAFMGIGLVLVVLEAYTPTFGFVGLSGLAIFGAGLYFLFPDAFRVSPALIGGMMIVLGAFLAFILVALIGSRRHGKMTGEEGLLHAQGVVDMWEDGQNTGYVIVEGERWKARASQPLKKGDQIKVIAVEGLVLVVKKLDDARTLTGFLTGQPIAQADA